MNKWVIIFFAFFFLKITSVSAAKSSSGGSFLSSQNTQELVLTDAKGLVSFSGGNTNITLHAMYGYFFMPHVEGAVEFNLENRPGLNSVTVFIDGIYNFQSDYNNAFFILGGFGLNSVSSRGSSSSTSSMKFGGGKRIQMWGPVSLMPIAWIQKDGSADMVTNIMPINFSILF
jgi:hypothetical protein